MAFFILNPHGERKWKGREEAFEKELKAFARNRLPGFASPEWVTIVDELPKTS
jgi:acyl-CoA synthetase (AMP-forming)/AMP-acid ligase II